MSSEKALKYDSAYKHIQIHVLHISKERRKVTAQKETSEPIIFDCEREYHCLLTQDEESKEDGLFLRWEGQKASRSGNL